MPRNAARSRLTELLASAEGQAMMLEQTAEYALRDDRQVAIVGLADEVDGRGDLS